MRKISVAIGAAAGIAVGTILGVLFAPDKGSETRKKISTKGKVSADLIRKKFAESMHRNGADGEAQQMKEKVN